MCREILSHRIPYHQQGLGIKYSFLIWHGRYDPAWSWSWSLDGGCKVNVAHALMMHLNSQCGPSCWDPYLSLKMLYTRFVECPLSWPRLDAVSASSSLPLLLIPCLDLYSPGSPFEWVQLSTTYCLGLRHFITEHHGVQSAQIAVLSTIRLIESFDSNIHHVWQEGIQFHLPQMVAWTVEMCSHQRSRFLYWVSSFFHMHVGVVNLKGCCRSLPSQRFNNRLPIIQQPNESPLLNIKDGWRGACLLFMIGYFDKLDTYVYAFECFKVKALGEVLITWTEVNYYE